MSDAGRYDEEVRLALVLNGGVSLAIWMGGVTCELDRARRAGFPALRDLEDVGVWADVCKVMGTRVVVDIVAGTSAGGLNGAVMAAAIARRAAMPTLREKWKSLGDFKDLLIREDGSDELSVLSGEFFANSISTVFDELEKSRTASADEDAAPSTVALTLTATGLHGQSELFEDQAGVEFSQRDYHVLHEFRRALEPDLTSNDLAATKVADTFKGATSRLARAARATASFPGAFAPVFGDRDWLMDGGVLDNEPFDPVLREMRKRQVERGTRRVLAYVVPSTGVDEDTAKPDPDKRPGFVKPIALATSLPRETNILEELTAVRGMLARVAADRGPTNRLLREAAEDAAGVEAKERVRIEAMAQSLWPLYQERRYSGGLWQIRQVLAGAQTGTVVLRPAPFWQAGGEAKVPWVPEVIDATGDAWGFGLSVAQDVVHNWLDAVRDVLLDRPKLGPTAGAISRSHRRLVAMAEAFEDGLRDSQADPQAGEAELAAVGTTCFEAAAGPGGSRIGAVVRAAATAIVDAKDELPDETVEWLALADGIDAAIHRQLVVAVVEGTFAAPTLDPAVPRFTFRRVGLRQANGRPARVLYGLELNHFGAFLRSSWRLSDWMWGRLDGCDHVAQLLLDPSRLLTLATTERAGLVDGLAGIVGNGDAVRAAVDGIAAAGDEEGAGPHVEALRALVVRRAQLDVLREELPIISREVAAGDKKTQVAAQPWIDGFAEAGDDPAKLWAAFELYTLGTDSADEVLDSDVGKEGRRDAVLSAVRALHKDETLPPIARKVSGVARGALRAYGASVDITDDVREHVSHVKDWVRAHWPGG